MRINKSYTPKLKPENINKQSGYGYRLYRVFEVFNNQGFSMLFNKGADADAIADWHNCTRTFSERLFFVEYKVRERRVHSGIHHSQTVHATGFIRSCQRA